MGTFLARSGSFNNLKVTNLPSTGQTSVVTVDSGTGQLYYAASESIKVTSASYALSSSYTPLNITNNTKGNMLVSSGSTSVIQGVKEVNFDYLYDTLGAGIGSSITPTLIISGGLSVIGSGSKLEYVNLSSNKTNTSSSRNTFMFGEGLISQKSTTFPNDTQIILGRYNNTGSNTYGINPSSQVILAVGVGEDDTNRVDALRIEKGGTVSIPFQLNVGSLSTNNFSATNLNVTSITGSLFGTASYANNARTSSYALNAVTASYLNDPFLIRSDTTNTVSALSYFTADKKITSANNITTDGTFLGFYNQSPTDIIYVDAVAAGDTNYGISVNGSMTLLPLDPLPTGHLGAMACSGSKLYFHNGSTWKEVSLL